MPKEIDYVSDLNDKYAAIELELQHKLKMIAKTESLLENSSCNTDELKKQGNSDLSLEAAKRRNYELLKSLEMSKARLRSRATFSPLETILKKAIGSYLKETALVPCTTKKSYGPTYV